MQTELKKAKEEFKIAKHIAKYSTDYDMTVVIKFVFLTFGGFIFALTILEILGRFVLKIQSPSGIYLTGEITHSLFGYIGGWTQAIVTFLFGKKLAEKLNETRNGSQTQNTENK